MSEVETSSTRYRKPSRGENRPPPAASSGSRLQQPRTSLKNNSSNHHIYSSLYDDDPGIMSEAETASTTRGKRSSSRTNSIPGSLGGYKNPQRSVQFRYPVAQYQGSNSQDSLGGLDNSGPSGLLFDEDPGIMSEADTSSTSGRKRRQLKAEQGRGKQLNHHMAVKVIRSLNNYRIIYFLMDWLTFACMRDALALCYDTTCDFWADQTK